MAHLPMDANRMLEAFGAMDGRLPGKATLVVGGGAAMVLAYQHRLATQDVDAFAAKGGLRLADLDSLAREVARELGVEPDWLNSHFQTFTHVLPQDYASRLRPVFEGKNLRVLALGPEDLLVMKCFAARDKDRPHARKLILLCNALEVVDARLSELVDKRVHGAEAAAAFFDDLRDEVDL